MADEVSFHDIKGFSRFTLNARKIINFGYTFAQRNGAKEYLPIHLFYSLLQDKGNIVGEIFNRVGVDVQSTINQIRMEVASHATALIEDSSQKDVTVTPLVNTVFSETLKQVINQSFLVASDLNHVYVGSEHILLALFKVPDIDFVKDIKELGVNFETLKNILAGLSLNIQEIGGKDKDHVEKAKEMSSLPFFCVDLNEKSKRGGFPEITGRDEEIQRLIHILSRKTKNNPILVGDAGVGKTAIVEGFVNKIVAKSVPGSFIDKKVLSLDIASILAGAKLRGDVEERITAVIEDAIADGKTIVFIDEIHNIVGAGSVGGKDSLDIANLLKPYLTGSELSVIGATTLDEYNKYFESDSALARRFQPIRVNELDVESSKQVLYGIKSDFEHYHKVKISQEAIDTAVELSEKFIQDRYLPDKAIDIIDEAAASLKIGREVAIEPEMSTLGVKLVKVQKEKAKALKAKDLEHASKMKTQEDNLINEISEVIEGKRAVKKKYPKTVTTDLVKEILVKWTQIPIAASDITDKTLGNLAKNLKERIIGQEHVIDNTALIIQKAHLGLNDPKRPLASFLFLGPTGVGKTELAKMLAKELFGSTDLIYQLNMSEFMEMHSTAKLIGSPPGYVGYQEGGQLTTFVRRKPYSVVLFDELEKAHPDTLNLLLQILEEGELTDGKGVKVSFKNCIIVMTSNIGAEAVSADNQLGFAVHVDENSALDQAYKDMREKILEDLKRSVRPEFLNRIDLIDVFRGLNKTDTLQIAKIQVEDLIVRLVSNGIILDVDSEVVEKINEEGFSKEFGGRNIRRKIQELLENGLAEFLLTGNIKRTKKADLIKLKVALNKDKRIEFKKG